MISNAKRRKLCLMLLNLLPLAIFAGFFRYGANVSFYMLPVLALLTVINVFLAASKEEFLIYNIVLLFIVVLGIFANGQLYFKYVYYDLAGKAVMGLEMLTAVILILVLTVIEFMLRALYDRRKRAR